MQLLPGPVPVDPAAAQGRGQRSGPLPQPPQAQGMLGQRLLHLSRAQRRWQFRQAPAAQWGPLWQQAWQPPAVQVRQAPGPTPQTPGQWTLHPTRGRTRRSSPAVRLRVQPTLTPLGLRLLHRQQGQQQEQEAAHISLALALLLRRRRRPPHLPWELCSSSATAVAWAHSAAVAGIAGRTRCHQMQAPGWKRDSSPTQGLAAHPRLARPLSVNSSRVSSISLGTCLLLLPRP